MTTKTETPETLEQLSAAERVAAEAAAKAQAAAQAAAAKAAAARDRADQARRDATKRYALTIRGSYRDRRPAAIKATTDARAAFDAAVIEGQPFGPAFLAMVKADADLYALELQYAEALGFLGQSPMRWPEPRPIDLGAALAAALKDAGQAMHDDAAAAMKEERRRWISQQVANDSDVRNADAAPEGQAA